MKKKKIEIHMKHGVKFYENVFLSDVLNATDKGSTLLIICRICSQNGDRLQTANNSLLSNN